jgi:hypothetical protein
VNPIVCQTSGVFFEKKKTFVEDKHLYLQKILGILQWNHSHQPTMEDKEELKEYHVQFS